jgi:hypothetical protein
MSSLFLLADVFKCGVWTTNVYVAHEPMLRILYGPFHVDFTLCYTHTAYILQPCSYIRDATLFSVIENLNNLTLKVFFFVKMLSLGQESCPLRG